MKSWMAFFIFLSAISFQGCFGPLNGAKKSLEAASLFASPVSVEIINNAAFKREGSIAFVPFVAGPEAEAGAEVDRLALLIVRGTADALGHSASTLRIATEEDLSGAPYILDGHIEEFSAPSGLAWSRRKGMLKVKGELRRQDTGEVLAVISGQKSFMNGQEMDQAAGEIGRSIAEGLVK